MELTKKEYLSKELTKKEYLSNALSYDDVYRPTKTNIFYRNDGIFVCLSDCFCTGA